MVAGCGGGGAPHDLTAGATSGTVVMTDSDFSVAGAGSSTIGRFSVTHGAGTIELAGRQVAAASYQRQSFPDLNLYQTLAVEKDRLWVLWFYCSTTNGSLTGIYYEATDGTPVTFEAASGTCQDSNQTSTVDVQFPAFDLVVPPLLPGFTIDGPDVHLDGAAPGTVTLGGARLTVLVFNTVDCSGCGTPGWTELHALLWDPTAGRVCFGIFYLFSNDHGAVELAWSLTLPELIDPADHLIMPANWTAR
jgi:hypothetical protein